MRAITHLVIHCSDTPPTMDIGADVIRRWHTDPPPNGNGWRDIGYHHVICRDGKVEDGREHAEIGAGVRGHNAHSLHICMIGGRKPDGTPDSNFTRHQWRALDELMTRLQRDYPAAQIVGHRDLDQRACPCFDARAW